MPRLMATKVAWVRSLSPNLLKMLLMEGINNRIKLIIRQSYGFKSFDPLRRKLLACLF